MEGLPAALKLCENLMRQFEPSDAQAFAAFVLAKVTFDTDLSVRDAMRKTIATWTQLALELPSPVEFVHCACGLPCTGQLTESGLVITHHGAACPGFKTRFADSSRATAKDHLGWSNTVPATTQATPAAGDDTSLRFSLLEL